MNIKKYDSKFFDKFGLTGKAPIIVGVSGGPDSLCLLDMLVKAKLPVVAAHYNHNLRTESGKDADFVRQAASEYLIPFHLAEGDVAAHAAQNKLSIEEAARQCRYRFLFDLAQNEAAEAVVVAHSADDQVETVLMHLLRGAGLSGLKGIAYRSILPEWDAKIPLVRPLLGVWREDIMAYCDENGLHPVMDHTNLDTAYFRNRLRHELLPYLKDYNPQIKQVLWRMAQSIESDFDVVQDTVQNYWNDVFISATEEMVSLKMARLNGFAVGIQRNILRKALELLRPDLRDINFDAVERALGFMIHPSRSCRMDLVDGIWLVKMGDLLVLKNKDAVWALDSWPQLGPDSPAVLPIGTRIKLGAGWVLAAEMIKPDTAGMPFTPDKNQAWFDMDMLDNLTLRVRHNGDRFEPFGMDGHTMKLSDCMINEHIPAFARKNYPLICSGTKIIWMPGIKAGQNARVSSSTLRILHISLLREK